MISYIFSAFSLFLESGLLTPVLSLACISMVILLARKIFTGVSE